MNKKFLLLTLLALVSTNTYTHKEIERSAFIIGSSLLDKFMDKMITSRQVRALRLLRKEGKQEISFGDIQDMSRKDMFDVNQVTKDELIEVKRLREEEAKRLREEYDKKQAYWDSLGRYFGFATLGVLYFTRPR